MPEQFTEEQLDPEQWEHEYKQHPRAIIHTPIDDLLDRAAIIIKRQGDELDKANMRDVRDEELIAKLRQQLAEAQALL